jgi:DNA-binding NarL/FixJ family response regulator
VPGVLARAADAGISGLLPMNGPLDGLLEAIRHARPGAMTVHPSLLVPVLQPAGAIKVPLLTGRERQVLALLAEGRDVRTMARSLNITLNTCRGYVKSILSKLDAHTQLQAVASARRMQLLA